MEHKEQPSAIDVSMETVAPILVVLAAGYVIGIFVLVIERCVHGNMLKCWPRGSVRRWRQIEYWRLLYHWQQFNKFTSARLRSYSHILLIRKSSASRSMILCPSFKFIHKEHLSSLSHTCHSVYGTHLPYLRENDHWQWQCRWKW